MKRYSVKDRRKLFSVGIMVKDDMWFFTSLTNDLMKINLANGQTFYITDISGYQPENDSDTDFLLYEDGKIYKLEKKGERILEYDISKNACRYIEIGFPFKDWGNFVAFGKYKDYLYIFLRMEEAVVQIDLMTEKVRKLSYSYRGNNGVKDRDSQCFCRACQVGNVMWLFSNTMKTILAYNMENNRCDAFNLSQTIDGCIDVVWKDSKFYILSKQYKVFEWNIDLDMIELVADFEEAYVDTTMWGRLVVTDITYILLPCLSNEILLLNRKGKGKKEIYHSYPSDFGYHAPEDWSKYIRPCEDENNYYFPMRSANYILKIGKKTGELTWIKPYVDNEKEGVQYYYSYYRKKNQILSDKSYLLSEYIDAIKSEDRRVEKGKKMVVGKEIWNRVISSQ